MGSAGCRTAEFLEQHQPAHEAAGIATGIAEQQPADRFFRAAHHLQVGIGFPGVVPGELSDELAAVMVDFLAHRTHLRSTLDHVQLRADEEHVIPGLVAPQLAGELGITQT